MILLLSLFIKFLRFLDRNIKRYLRFNLLPSIKVIPNYYIVFLNEIYIINTIVSGL